MRTENGTGKTTSYHKEADNIKGGGGVLLHESLINSGPESYISVNLST